MKVLSLFDGMSCGIVALQRAGITVDRYVAYEINKYAIEVSKKNHSYIEHRGDVTTADFTEFKGFDLLLGGSPCQGFSIGGKQLNFEDPRSKLFFEFVRALKEVKPKYFLLENVKMKKEYENIITKILGVQPIEINSSVLSAQNRKRIYWTNIPGIQHPEDRRILLQDIVHENNNDDIDLEPYKVPLNENIKILDKESSGGKIGYFGKDSQANRFYSINKKSVTLCGEAGGGAAKMGQYLFGTLSHNKDGIDIDGYIRKLTPIECERLQTLPDGYTEAEGVSETQRYKMLGNGWTVDVIAHILKYIKNY